MNQSRLKQAIAEYEDKVRTLSATLHSQLVEARLLRRTLETLVEVRRAITAQLERPPQVHTAVGLKHAHRRS
jgi:hypothetical protein